MDNTSFNCDGSSVSRSEGGDSGVLSVGDKYKIFFYLAFHEDEAIFSGNNILQGSVHHIVDLHSLPKKLQVKITGSSAG